MWQNVYLITMWQNSGFWFTPT